MIKNGFMVLYLLGLSVYDGKEKKVPVVLLSIGILVAVFWMIHKCIKGDLWQCVLGLIPGLLLFAMAWVTNKAGYADGTVLAVVGVLEGYQSCMLILGISLCAMSVFAIVLLCLRRVSKDTQLPYIPFLCGGYLVWKVLGG